MIDQPIAVPTWFLLSIAAIYGLLIGSFLNVVIYRLPAGQSLARPRSRCPKCETQIAWYDNIPVFSWVLLRGRCRSCANPIAWRYPAVEVLTSAVAIGATIRFAGLEETTSLVALGATVVYFAFLASLIVISFIDIDHMIIPDRISLPMIPIGIIATTAFSVAGVAVTTPIMSVLGAVIGYGIIWIIRWVGTRALGQEAMGLGDAKLMAMAGAWLGPWPSILLVLLIASFSGAIHGIGYSILRRTSLRGVEMPFGPWLCLGIAMALLLGDPIVHSYLQAIGGGAF